MADATITIRTSNPIYAKAKIKEIVRSFVSPRDSKAKRLFFAFFANEFLDLQHRAFLQRAQAGSDEYGDQWNPLSPKTIAAKKNIPGVKNPDWINVRHGRLAASLQPVTQREGRLYSTKDMLIEIVGSTISFEITVPYAERVDRQRAIFSLAEALVELAVERAVIRTAKRLFPEERF